MMRKATKRFYIFVAIFVISFLSTKTFAEPDDGNKGYLEVTKKASPNYMRIHFLNNSHYLMERESAIVENGNWFSIRRPPFSVEPYSQVSAEAFPNSGARWLTIKTTYILKYRDAPIGKCSSFSETHSEKPTQFDFKCEVSVPHEIYTEKRRDVSGIVEHLYFILTHRNTTTG